MPSSRYYYDPLDRLAARVDPAQGTEQHFYQLNRLASAITAERQRTILVAAEQLLAQQERSATGEERYLLATDQQHSVLRAVSAQPPIEIAYSPYGHRRDPGLLPGFTGQEPDPLTGHYLLGNGYRAYNPVLRRFNSPDSLSPFDKGGLNAYVYCHGDPVNRRDPSGHADFLDALKEAVPYLALVASAVGSTVLYKFTKVRFRKWTSGNATKADKFVASGTVGTIASGILTATGSIIRIVDPDSPIATPLMALGAIGVIGSQGLRYTGHKLGKPVPVVPRSIPRGLPLRQSVINRGASNIGTTATNIRTGQTTL